MRDRWRGGWLTAPPFLSRVIAVLGIVTLVSALTPALHERFRAIGELLPPFAPAVARAGAAAAGLMLVVLARGLRRHKHRAWVAATTLSLVAAVLHLAKGLDVEEGLFAAVVLSLLVAGRKHFDARPAPRSVRALVGTLVASVALASTLGWVFLTVMDQHQAAATTAADRTAESLMGLVGVEGPVVFTTNHAAEVATIILLVLGMAALGPVIAVVLRPAGGPTALSLDDEERLRRLLAEHGEVDSLGYFALRRDRSVIFSPSEKAAVGYRVVGGVSLAGGDPVGDPEAWPGAIEAWQDEARRFGWIPAVLGAGARGARTYQRAGLDVLEIGDEAIIDTTAFTLEGRAMRPVRQAVNRVAREGYRICCDRLSDLSTEDLDAVRHAARAWRVGDTERGFSMALGRLGDRTDGECLVVRAMDAAGELRGVLHFVPWGVDGLSLDLMRHAPDSENGTVEAMVSGVAAVAERLGVRRISLNFAVFRSALERGEQLGAGPLAKAWRAVLMLASRWWQIEALYRANVKYEPTWVPRYLCLPRPADLVAVVIAVLRAEAFLVVPGRPRPSGGSAPASRPIGTGVTVERDSGDQPTPV